MLRKNERHEKLATRQKQPWLNAAIAFSTARLLEDCRGTVHGTVLVWIARIQAWLRKAGC
jgi:hypothetical protein